MENEYQILAKILIDTFYKSLEKNGCYVKDSDCSIDFEDTKAAAMDSAIICIDQILDVLGGPGVYGFADPKVALQFEKVKAELEKI